MSKADDMPILSRLAHASIRWRPVDLHCPPAALLAGLSQLDQPALLESSAFHPTFGRYSVLACRPVEVLSLRDGVLRAAAALVQAQGDDGRIRQAIAAALSSVSASAGDLPVPYAPGWIGYIGYEVGRHIERLPGRAVRDTNLPDLRLALYDAMLVYDALERRWFLTELVPDVPSPQAGLAARDLMALAARAAQSPHHDAPAPTERADAAHRPAAAYVGNFTPEQYRRAVARCVDYIAAGDIFQVNLSQRFTVAGAPAPAAIYRALRRRNPAWHSAYLEFQQGGNRCAVVSSSPELFLRVHGGRVVTRPIKGTRPRIGRPDADHAASAELVSSPKDNAELAMIIDLLRNDLGRVCEYGSVCVTDPRRLETHPTVFHLVGTVEGRLRPGVGPAELLWATFPGGSITGAPKIRAMEIIDELEPVARGVYTGCIGYVGVHGDSEWNIAIRTIVCDGPDAYVQVGGGIVADSIPDSEYQETLDKARALLEAIQQARQADSCYSGGV